MRALRLWIPPRCIGTGLGGFANDSLVLALGHIFETRELGAILKFVFCK